MVKPLHTSWPILCEGSSESVTGFAFGFRMSPPVNVPDIARTLEKGTVVCSPMYVAGPDHVSHMLDQAEEYWLRGIFIARNKSIDLLMRITCQSQISRALAASSDQNAKELALFGITSNEEKPEKLAQKMTSSGGTRDDSLLELSQRKERFLRRFHSIPSHFSRNQIVDFLLEKSVLLVFSK